MIINILLFIVIPIIILGLQIKLGDRGFLLLLASVISGACLLLALIAQPINYIEYSRMEREYIAFSKTLDIMRQNENSIENAAIQKDIADWNQKVASAQYYQGVFPLFIPSFVQNWSEIY